MNKIVSLLAGSVLLGTSLATAAEAAEGWARSSTRLRAGPGSSYPPITRVVAGEALDVHGCLGDWSWCDVSTDDERGWLPGSRIALVRDGRRIALPGIAALAGLGIVGFERDVYWRDHYRDRPFYGRIDHDRERSDRPRRAPDAPTRAEPDRMPPRGPAHPPRQPERGASHAGPEHPAATSPSRPASLPQFRAPCDAGGACR